MKILFGRWMMKMSFGRRKMFLFVPAAFLLLASCAITGKGLMTRPVRDADVGDGPFAAILYSTSEHEFLETAVFLDLEGDAYELQPFGASFNYSLVNGLAGAEADRQAREFITARVMSNKIELRAIIGPEGTPVGYELRALQLPVTYGESDVLDISYIPRQDGRITIYVRLKDRIERLLERENGSH
jgi:hypothetical protein